MKAQWRFQGKLILLFLGLLILLGILVKEWRKREKSPIEEIYKIEDSWLKNVYITSANEDGVTYFLGESSSIRRERTFFKNRTWSARIYGKDCGYTHCKRSSGRNCDKKEYYER